MEMLEPELEPSAPLASSSVMAAGRPPGPLVNSSALAVEMLLEPLAHSPQLVAERLQGRLENNYELPVVLAVMNALKTTVEISTNPLAPPGRLHWENFASAWRNASLNGRRRRCVSASSRL